MALTPKHGDDQSERSTASHPQRCPTGKLPPPLSMSTNRVGRLAAGGSICGRTPSHCGKTAQAIPDCVNCDGKAHQRLQRPIPAHGPVGIGRLNRNESPGPDQTTKGDIVPHDHKQLVKRRDAGRQFGSIYDLAAAIVHPADRCGQIESGGVGWERRGWRGPRAAIADRRGTATSAGWP